MEIMRRFLPGAFALALAAGACGQSSDAPTAVPIALAPPAAIDNFSGKLNVLGSNYHQFQHKQAGEVDITLTSTSYAPTTDPDTGASVPSTRTDPIPPLTVLVGTPSATTIGLQCSPLAFNSQYLVVTATASNTPQLKGDALAGNFCISVSDPSG